MTSLNTAAAHVAADKSDINTKRTEKGNSKSYNTELEGDLRTLHLIVQSLAKFFRGMLGIRKRQFTSLNISKEYPLFTFRNVSKMAANVQN